VSLTDYSSGSTETTRALNASLAEVGFRSAVDVLATYAGRASDLRAWLAGAQS